MHILKRLFAAIELDDTELLQRLLDEGACVNGGLDIGTPLAAAVQRGSIDAVKLLIARGCDVNLRDREGESALSLSLGLGQRHIAECLIQSGCRVNRESARTKLPPISVAVQSGNDQVISALIGVGCDVDKLDGDGCTPLHHAVQNGHHGAVDALLHAGAKVNVRSHKGEGLTPLHAAVIRKDLAMVNALLAAERLCALPKNQRVVDINKRSGLTADTPLHFAIFGGSLEIVNVLVMSGASLVVANAKGNVPLVSCLLSSTSARGEIALTLLEHGGAVIASPHVPLHSSGVAHKIPLHVAVRLGDVGMVSLLLARDDLDICQKSWSKVDGLSVVHACLDNGCSVLLLDRLLEAAQERGVRLEVRGWDCLLAAVRWPRHLQKLIDYGLDVLAERDGETILHRRECLLRPESVATLLRNGVLQERNTTSLSRTPLHRLAALNEHNSDDEESTSLITVAGMLLDYGADINARDHGHLTPALVACIAANFHLFDYLSSCGGAVHSTSDLCHLVKLCSERQTFLMNIDGRHYMVDIEASVAHRTVELSAVVKPLWALCRQSVMRRLALCRSFPISASVALLPLSLSCKQLLTFHNPRWAAGNY